MSDPTPTSRRFVALIALAGAALLALAACGSNAKGIPAGEASDRVGRLATLPDGRVINLRCSGRGAPTVLFESGYGADAYAWSSVQPALQQTTRVCAYDRAGYSYSSPGPMPRDGAAIARDLDEALTAAKIEGPFVLVGHSAGGLYARIFAARRLSDTVGLVLLDPTIENLAQPGAPDGLEGIRRQARRCLTASQTSPFPPVDDPQWNGCGVKAGASTRALEVGRNPQTWLTRLSELDTLFNRTSLQVARARDLLRDVPTYVITASETAEAAPALTFGDVRSLWTLGHIEIAGRSRLGYQQTVVSTHLVMIKRPDVVIAAVKAMVLAVRAGRPPPPLPANETDAPPQAIAPTDTFAVPNPFDRPFVADPPN